MEKFVPCSVCQDGYIFVRDIDGNDEARACDCLRLFQYMNLITRDLNKCGIGSSMLTFNPDWFQGNEENVEKAKKYVNHFKDDYRNTSLYFFGDNHTQKTTMAKFIGCELMKKGLKVEFIIMNDLINLLVEEKFKESNPEKIKKLYDADLLIIDEVFDSKKITLYKSGFQLPFLDSFLRNRLEKVQKSILFTSNVKMKDIDLAYSVSVIDLVNRNVEENELVFIDKYDANKFDNSLWKNGRKKL